MPSSAQTMNKGEGTKSAVTMHGGGNSLSEVRRAPCGGGAWWMGVGAAAVVSRWPVIGVDCRSGGTTIDI